MAIAAATATAAETQKHSQSQQEAAGEQEKKGSGSRISRVGSSVKKKTRRSCSSLDGYSVPAIIINEKQVMSNRGTVPFRRSSSLSAEIGNSKLEAAAFGLERQQCAFQSPRNKGLVVPWILRNRNISRNRRKGVTNTDSKSRQADDGRGPFKQTIVQEEEEEEEEEISYDDDESKPEESEDETPSARLNRYHYHHHCHHTRCHETIRTDLSSSSCSKGNNGLCLSDKYKPKRFEDILGHQINVMALSSAIKKEKVAPLYLFHGPGGTGKSCVARIFSMACNCESPWPSKPCWSCRGCSRGVYMKELCFSGTRCCSSSFHQLRALLQSTAFFSGLKVFVFEEFHSFSPQDWEELLLMSELGSMAFVLVVDDPNRVPNSVTSRCHKFGFQKLKDVDIALKLARIVACEGLRIEKDALRLITGKAHGSLREAENILDQLALLGTRITTSMVRQLVGLVAQDELIGLLDTAMSADAIKTVRQTRELIETGIEPQALLTQLASLITDLISFSSASSTLNSSKHKSRLRNKSLHQLAATSAKSQSSQILCHALSILIETEKQMQSSTSSEQATTWLVSSLLQIASYRSHSGSTDIVLPQDFISSTNEDLASTTTSVQQTRQNFGQINGNGLSVLGHQIKNKSPHNFGDALVSNKTINSSQECVEGTINLADQITDMEQVWNNILARIQSQNVRDFLHHQGRLNSLTVSRANAIVHLMFKGQEDKIVAENSEETISAALKLALGCPVTVNISLQPMQLESINKRLSASANENHGDGDRFHSRQVTRTFLPTNSEQPLTSDGRQHDLRHSASTSQRSGSILSECHASRSRLHDNIETPNAQQQLLQVDTHLHDTPANTSVSIPQLVTHPSMAPMGTQSQIQDKVPIMTSTSHRKQRLVSLSSIQQTEASVEPYSQDLLFENANTDRLKGTSRNSNIHRGFTKAKEHEQQTASFVGFNRSWSCTNRICRSKTMKDDVQHSTRGDYK